MGDFYTLYTVFSSHTVYLEEVFKESGYQVIPASRKGNGLIVYDSPTLMETEPMKSLWFVGRRNLKHSDWEERTIGHQLSWELAKPDTRYMHLRPKTVYDIRKHYKTHEAIENRNGHISS